MIPTSIDGTDITGATIDGTDVTEITVDGDTVFSAGPPLPPVSNGLQAWFPFENDLKDATGNFTSSASGVSLQASGGVTDVNTGTNSGFADTSGNGTITMNDGGNFMTRTSNGLPFTMMGWFQQTSFQNFAIGLPNNSAAESDGIRLVDGNNQITLDTQDNGTGRIANASGGVGKNVWIHVAGSNDGGTNLKVYVNGTLKQQGFNQGPFSRSPYTGPTILGNSSNGVEKMDDVRFYDRQLSDSEIQTIYNNTQP